MRYMEPSISYKPGGSKGRVKSAGNKLYRVTGPFTDEGECRNREGYRRYSCSRQMMDPEYSLCQVPMPLEGVLSVTRQLDGMILHAAYSFVMRSRSLDNYYWEFIVHSES